MKEKVAQTCPTLCDPVAYTVRGILQARILERVAFALHTMILQGIFPTQELNSDLPHCRWILYQGGGVGAAGMGGRQLVISWKAYVLESRSIWVLFTHARLLSSDHHVLGTLPGADNLPVTSTK